MKVLVLAEHDGSALKDATLSAVTAGAKLGEVTLLVAGLNIDAAARQAAAVAGVTKVIQADAAPLAQGLAEALAPMVVTLMADHDAFVAPATTAGKGVAPRVAASLDVMQISEVVAIVDASTFVRPIYAGNALATVKTADATPVLTIRGTGFEKAASQGGAAPIERFEAVADTGLSRLVGVEIAKSERPDLNAAKVIVSGGRALQSGENFRAVIEPLADKLGAGVGASRAAVDAGYVPNDYQVGQTGKIVAPEVYIAIGISGAIQHLAGMKDSKTIVAINKDPDAPIFQIADYGLVGDLFTLVPELTARL